MKFTVPYLTVGQKVKVKVAEVVGTGDLIINFYGDLLRVKNASSKKFTTGDDVYLKVQKVNPLQLVLAKNNRNHIDVSI